VRSNTREAGKSTLVSPRLIRGSAWSIDRMTVPARQKRVANCIGPEQTFITRHLVSSLSLPSG
jgi:hypothetical protein